MATMASVGEHAARLRLQLFGSFRLTAPGGVSVRITSRRGRALLAYLCFNRDQGATRGQLAGLLWSDRGEDQARSSLRQCLLEVRTALPPNGQAALDIGRERVSLRAGGCDADIDDLEDALRSEGGESLTTFLREVGDDLLLADLNLSGLIGDWLDQTRAWIEERLARAVHAGLKRQESDGAWPAVRDLADAFLRRQPLDEPAVAAAMRADIALGSNSAAHRRFQILKDALAQEFGVDPGAEAVAALQSIKAPRARAPNALAGAHVPPLVVVAAFEDAQLEPQDVRLVQAIRDEVVSGLSRFRDLRIITDHQPAGAVSAETWEERGAAYVLGASFRPGVDALRQATQLLRIGDRRVIWSDTLALPKAELAWAIDQTIAKVVGAVLPTIDDDVMQSGRLPADDAYKRYLAARDAAADARSYAEAQAAARDLEQLVAAQPSFVLPSLPLARLYNTDFNYTRAGASGDAEHARALDLARTALSVDRAHVHGYTVKGWCHLRRRDWGAAQLHFDQAVTLNPFHADRIMEAGFGNIFLGSLHQARTLLDRCLLLNPTPKDMFFTDLGLLELVDGDHERAATYFELVARPTIWDLIYSAINSALGGHVDPAKASAANAAIRAIWVDADSASVDALVAWIGNHNPFKDPEVERRFLGGARRLLD